MRKREKGVYVSEDGRYTADRQPYERECECLACQVGGACPSGGIATDWFWTLWDEVTGDYPPGVSFCSFDTLREVKEYVAGMEPS